MVRAASRKAMYGVGINDADYVTQPSDKLQRCPIFDRWHSMIRRCYSENSLARHPRYEMVTVCQEWRTFSNFKSWMEMQDWEGLALDKDILGDGNLYSPETCRFIPQEVNSFFAESTQSDTPGVRLKFKDGRKKPYIAQAMVDGVKKHLGVFSDTLKAHRAWQDAKLSGLDRLILEYPTLDKDIMKIIKTCRQQLQDDIESGEITRRLK